jgi:excisionase family DNA binding protein
VTVKDAAEHLGISTREVYDSLAPKGKLSCYRFGRRIVIDRADLDAYREAHRVEPKAGVSSQAKPRPPNRPPLPEWPGRDGRAVGSRRSLPTPPPAAPP